MIRVRGSRDRGRADHGWLDARHTFSFDAYRDPEHTGFRRLRVLNEDRVAPGAGFPRHPHRDMEILTWVLEGGLEHHDNLGNRWVLRPGEIQRMTAGAGILHSEMNASRREAVHLLQIWIEPERSGLTASVERRVLPVEKHPDRFLLAASPDGREGSVRIHQDTSLWIGRLGRGGGGTVPLRAGRHAWVQVARGRVSVNGVDLSAGDGAAISEEARLEFAAGEEAEALVFDLG